MVVKNIGTIRTRLGAQQKPAKLPRHRYAGSPLLGFGTSGRVEIDDVVDEVDLCPPQLEQSATPRAGIKRQQDEQGQVMPGFGFASGLPEQAGDFAAGEPPVLSRLTWRALDERRRGQIGVPLGPHQGGAQGHEFAAGGRDLDAGLHARVAILLTRLGADCVDTTIAPPVEQPIRGECDAVGMAGFGPVLFGVDPQYLGYGRFMGITGAEGPSALLGFAVLLPAREEPFSRLKLARAR